MPEASRLINIYDAGQISPLRRPLKSGIMRLPPVNTPYQTTGRLIVEERYKE
jgi:hypothetical protein